MTYTLILYFLLSGNDAAFATKSLGNYVTESQCWEAAEHALSVRSFGFSRGTGINRNIIALRGAWIATCSVTK